MTNAYAIKKKCHLSLFIRLTICFYPTVHFFFLILSSLYSFPLQLIRYLSVIARVSHVPDPHLALLQLLPVHNSAHHLFTYVQFIVCLHMTNFKRISLLSGILLFYYIGFPSHNMFIPFICTFVLFSVTRYLPFLFYPVYLVYLSSVLPPAYLCVGHHRFVPHLVAFCLSSNQLS